MASCAAVRPARPATGRHSRAGVLAAAVPVVPVVLLGSALLGLGWVAALAGLLVSAGALAATAAIVLDRRLTHG